MHYRNKQAGLRYQNNGRVSQSGFTLVELVLVIMLMGILTATALPRFIGISDNAHQAVIGAVQSGLLTGMILYHTTWFVSGKSNGAFSDFGNTFPSAEGFPVGTSGGDNNEVDFHSECGDVFNGILTEGAPSIDFPAGAVVGAITQGEISAVSSDFIAKITAADICSFAYIAQFTNVTNDDIPVLDYNATDGSVEIASPL